MGGRDLHAGILTRKFPSAEGTGFFLAFWLIIFLFVFLVIQRAIFCYLFLPKTTRKQVNVM